MGYYSDDNSKLALEKELRELDDLPITIEGREAKSSQCYHLSTDPVHVLYNTNCPDDLRSRIQSILLRYQARNKIAPRKDIPKKILVHNSDDDLMQLIRNALYAKGYEVKFTRHREDMPGMVTDFKPDLVLIDNWQENVLADLQGNPQMNNMPVVLMTGQQGKDPIHVWPVSSVIKKPFTLSQLTQTIDRALLENN